jgi:curved DNA-binding protein CbpA
MTEIDLYEVLQVHPRAEPDVNRAAHRALARLFHPDLGGDERRMIELNGAWAVLGDPRRRSAYDDERGSPTVPAAPPPCTAQTIERDAPSRARYDTSRLLDFGRYSGWSLKQLAETNPNYLEWLVRTSIGRGFRSEVEVLLASASTPAAVKVAPRHQRRSRWRR